MAENLVSADDILGRKPPFSQEAEEAVIGGILLDPSCLPKVIEILKPESFYRPQHKQLFSIIMRMFAGGTNEDIITVINEAVTMGVFESSAMAKTYLMGLMQNVPSTANIESYCKIIDEKYHIRSLINVANNILETAYDGSVDAETMLDTAEQQIYDIRQGKETAGLTRINEVMTETFTHLQELSGPDSKEHLGSTSGFSQLDAITTGLNKTDLIVLAARPAMGKSALALNIPVN